MCPRHWRTSVPSTLIRVILQYITNNRIIIDNINRSKQLSFAFRSTRRERKEKNSCNEIDQIYNKSRLFALIFFRWGKFEILFLSFKNIDERIPDEKFRAACKLNWINLEIIRNDCVNNKLSILLLARDGISVFLTPVPSMEERLTCCCWDRERRRSRKPWDRLAYRRVRINHLLSELGISHNLVIFLQIHKRAVLQREGSFRKWSNNSKKPLSRRRYRVKRRRNFSGRGFDTTCPSIISYIYILYRDY